LDGPDPPSDRPKWLHVQAKGFRAIDISKVSVYIEDISCLITLYRVQR